MFTKAFWKATTERTVGTFGATLVGLATSDHIIGVLSLDWGQILAASGIIAGLTLAKCLAAAGTGGGPSMTNAEVLK